MSTKIFNTRLQLKYDSFEHWSAEDKQFKLLAGEIAVVNVPAKTGEVASEPAILFKVGDGNKTFNELPWASGLAADVYDWAKREKGLASEIIYKPEVKDDAGTVVTDAIYVNTAISSLEAAVKTLEGIFSEEGEDGTVTGISDIIKNYIDTNLNKADSAQAGKYVSAVSQSNGVISVERADLPTYTLTTGDANGTVKFNGTAVAVKGLGSAAYEAKDAFDATGTGAAEAAKVLGTDADVAGTATVHGALKSAAAAAKAGTDAANAVEGKLTEYKTSNDAALAEVKATADAAAVKASVDAAFEGVNATIATLATKADVAASFETVNGEIADINEAIAGINEAAATHATKTELAIAKEEALAYTDDIKEAILGGEGLKDTFDTLLEIQTWIEGDGVNTTELTAAIAAETKAREEADEDFETRVSALEGKVDVEKVSDAINAGVASETALREAADTALSNRIKDLEDNKAGYATTTQVATAKQEAIDEAAADATSKADAAEADANAYTDEKIGELHTVASTGKIEDLDQEAEYIIFNCGTATTLVSEPVTE